MSESLQKLPEDASPRKPATELWKLAIDSGSDAAFWIDREGVFVYVNDAGCRSLGYDRDELLGKHIWDVNPTSTRASWSSAWEKFREQRSIRLESTHRRKDGHVFPVEIASTFVVHDGQELLCCFAHDITARKRAEDALRQSEERFQLALRGANDGLWDWDLQTDEVYYSPRWKLMIGYATDELENRLDTWKSLVHPDDRERTLAVVRDLLEGRCDKFEVEFRMRHKDGSFRHVLSRAFLAGAAGGHRRLVGTHVDITERKRAEERLAHAQELMQYVISHAQSAIAVHDREMRYIYVSEQYVKQYKVKERDLIGRHHYEVFPDLPQKWRDVHQRVLAGAVEGSDEDPYVREDGSVDWTRWESRPWYERDGSIGGLIVYTEVITERKRREETLRKSEEQLRESQRIAKIGNWGWDIANNTLDWSDEAFRRFDKDPGTFTPTVDFFVSVIHPDDRETVRKAIRDSLESDAPYHIQPRIRNESGREWVLEGFGIVERDETGKPLRFAGTVQDITARQQAEEKLRQSEQFVRNILDTVDEGFIVIDREYRILTANKAYCDQVGKTRDEVTGSRCHETSHGCDRLCHEAGEECAVRLVFATGQTHSALHRHRDREGRVLYVETKAFPVKDASGAVVSVIETVNNITEKHLLEEERLKTQKLESIGTLAGGIAHDFNNLLQGIFGYISMARMSLGQPERSLAMLEQAERALHQSVNLTTQLLTFSKGGKPVKKRMALPPVIENAVKFALSGSRSEYRIQSEPGLWQVDADEGQLGQVIQNVVLNADQAMPLGGSVVVSARNLPAADEGRPRGLKGGDYVVVSITDTGAGMPQEYFEKIFDPYFTTKEKGSGLGLATSYSIIRNHGGRIDVQSEPGKGSCFTFYLPALAAVAEEPLMEEASAGMHVGRILVMDDEEFVRNVAGELLAALGHTAVLVDRGETALEAYHSARESGQPFDAVILDLTIRGGMGGEETVGKLLEIDPDVKAIVSSGYSDDATLADYRRKGFVAFLKKPYKFDELQNTLRSVLG